MKREAAIRQLHSYRRVRSGMKRETMEIRKQYAAMNENLARMEGESTKEDVNEEFHIEDSLVPASEYSGKAIETVAIMDATTDAMRKLSEARSQGIISEQILEIETRTLQQSIWANQAYLEQLHKSHPGEDMAFHLKNISQS